MKVSVDNKNENYLDSNIEEVNQWWMKVTSEIYNEDRLIYCVEVDHKQLYMGYEDIIVNNYSNIQDINIITKTKKESFVETEQALDEYLERFIPSAEAIAAYFYGQLEEEHWNKFSQLIDGLNWIIKSLEFLKVLSPIAGTNVQVLSELGAKIGELGESLQDEDHVLCGDLLNYEIIPTLKKIKTRVIN